MRGLEPEVLDTVWEAVKSLLPHREDNHPLGCHNPRYRGSGLLSGNPDQVGDGGVRGPLSSGSWMGRCRTPGCGPAVTKWVAECVFDGVASRGLVPDIGTLHLDRGYDSGRIRQQAAAWGIGDLNCPKRCPPGTATTKQTTPIGMGWSVERTNSWLTNGETDGTPPTNTYPPAGRRGRGVPAWR